MNDLKIILNPYFFMNLDKKKKMESNIKISELNFFHKNVFLIN